MVQSRTVQLGKLVFEYISPIVVYLLCEEPDEESDESIQLFDLFDES